MADFYSLESERTSGMSVGPVPVTRMFDFLRSTGTDPDWWPECIAYWQALDRESMKHYGEKVAKSAPKASKTPRAGRGVVAPEDYPRG